MEAKEHARKAREVITPQFTCAQRALLEWRATHAPGEVYGLVQVCKDSSNTSAAQIKSIR